jgi:tetratricopeptide (TPR) repeat protein
MRYEFHELRNLAGIRASEGQDVNVAASMFNDECLADMQKLAKLRPEDHKALAAALFIEMSGYCAKHPDELNNSKPLMAVLPEKIKRSVEENMRLLDCVIQRKNSQSAAAAEVQAVLWTAVGDAAKAETAARRAIELNPARDLAWEIVIDSLLDKKMFREAVEACLARLKCSDVPFNRLVAAVAYSRLGEFDKAEEQVRLGLDKGPKDVASNLAMAVLLIRRAALEPAGRYLEIVEKALDDSTPDETRREFAVTRAVLFALSGETEKGEEWVN